MEHNVQNQHETDTDTDTLRSQVGDDLKQLEIERTAFHEEAVIKQRKRIDQMLKDGRIRKISINCSEDS